MIAALALVLALAADEAAAPAPVSPAVAAVEQSAQKFWLSPSVLALLDYRDALRQAQLPDESGQYSAMQDFLRAGWDPLRYSYAAPRLPGAGNPPDEAQLQRLGAKLPEVHPSYFMGMPGWLLVGPRIGRAGLYQDAGGGTRKRIALPRGQFALLEAQALHSGAPEKLAIWNDTRYRVEFSPPLPVVMLSASGELALNGAALVEAPERAPGCDEGEMLEFSHTVENATARAGIDLVLVGPPPGLAARASVSTQALEGATGRTFDLDGDHEADVYVIQYSADPDAGWDPRMEAYFNVAGQWVYGGGRLWVHCRN